MGGEDMPVAAFARSFKAFTDAMAELNTGGELAQRIVGFRGAGQPQPLPTAPPPQPTGFPAEVMR